MALESLWSLHTHTHDDSSRLSLREWSSSPGPVGALGGWDYSWGVWRGQSSLCSFFPNAKKHWPRRDSVFGLAVFRRKVTDKYNRWGFCSQVNVSRGSHAPDQGQPGADGTVHPGRRALLDGVHWWTVCCSLFQMSRATFSETPRPRCFSPSVWRSPWGGHACLRSLRYAWEGSQIRPLDATAEGDSRGLPGAAPLHLPSPLHGWPSSGRVLLGVRHLQSPAVSHS